MVLMKNCLLQNIDIDVLNEVGSELQTLVNEAYEEERANPEIIFTEGWGKNFRI